MCGPLSYEGGSPPGPGPHQTSVSHRRPPHGRGPGVQSPRQLVWAKHDPRYINLLELEAIRWPPSLPVVPLGLSCADPFGQHCSDRLPLPPGGVRSKQLDSLATEIQLWVRPLQVSVSTPCAGSPQLRADLRARGNVQQTVWYLTPVSSCRLGQVRPGLRPSSHPGTAPTPLSGSPSWTTSPPSGHDAFAPLAQAGFLRFLPLP